MENIFLKTGLSEKELLGKAYEMGFQSEKKFGGCSQCVLIPFIELLDLDVNVFTAATGLAGGIAITTEGPCGAFLGGILCLNYYFGRDYNNFENSDLIRKPFEMILDFRNKFIEQYGSYICREIHKKTFGRTFDLNNEKDWIEFDKAGAHIDKCTDVVGKASMWVMEILINSMNNKVSYE